jgi:predicted HicB family RNase H-like nuclease
MTKNKVINFRIEEELYTLLAKQAKRKNISVSNYIRDILNKQIILTECTD